MSSSDAALLQEIQRLSGAIDRHKVHEPKPPYAPRFHQSRNAYVNPAMGNKKYVNPAIANKKYVNPAIANKARPPISSSNDPLPTTATRDLVIDGVAFESSNRKLTRKDLITNKPESSGASAVTQSFAAARPRVPYTKRGGNLVPSSRVHKPKYSKGKRPAGRNNMVLDNIKGTRSGQMSKRRKMDKQCRFFTMTGVCQRGLTCPYQHDPEKIAICPLFLTHSCPNGADTCQLSHDSNPSRVPFCHHFANHGRCNRDDCPYPHVRVGPRNGVCRDFAVLGYCDKGIDCDKQHVKECPDFAEKGTCPNKSCKLPHVIRANRRRQPANPAAQAQTATPATTSGINHQQPSVAKEEYSLATPSAISSAPAEPGAAEEYISLTFEESEDEDEDSEEENGEDGDENENEGDEDAESITGERDREAGDVAMD